MDYVFDLSLAAMIAFAAVQILYTLTFLIDFYLFSLPVDQVRMADVAPVPERDYPHIVLFYPVLREQYETMHTTLVALSRLKYPADKRHIIALPNWDDPATLASLRRLQVEFPFLDVIETPPTAHPSWDLVWKAWDRNPKAYWWHVGRHARDANLPPKKTRQLIYGLYHTVEFLPVQDFLVNYIDADSAPAPDHFLAAVAGMQRFDVLQSTNVAGNLNASLAASWHAFDHMAWDGLKYRHLSAGGKHPYWMLGKGLFFRASDLVALGSFHPWITIEDPEVGMRFWKNGKRLGIIEKPLIEEVPLTLRRGVTQRKRWVCGFFQSLGEPLRRMEFTPIERAKAWLNFLPCLSLWLNAVGFPLGAWAIWDFTTQGGHIPLWLVSLSAANVTALVASMAALYVNTWRRTGLVLESVWARMAYMLRINPLFVALWWVLWLLPLGIGLWMYLSDRGRVWERTEKINANQQLIELEFGGAAHQRAA